MAANWIFVGQTQGRGKKDIFYQYLLPLKDIYLYPLQKMSITKLNETTCTGNGF